MLPHSDHDLFFCVTGVIRSENDRQIWMRDINSAASRVTQSYVTDETDILSEQLMEKMERTAGSPDTGGSESNAIQLRTNTMAYVCWHRNCSIGREEYEIALSVSSSGL